MDLNICAPFAVIFHVSMFLSLIIIYNRGQRYIIQADFTPCI